MILGLAGIDFLGVIQNIKANDSVLSLAMNIL